MQLPYLSSSLHFIDLKIIYFTSMKKLVFLGVLLVIIFTLSFYSYREEGTDKTVVIELFTSQGCSSCPAADKLLMELAQNENVIPLSFHVSYWNYLGWKDPYSSDQYTERQRAYAKKLHLSSIYTPQMIVNGTNEFVGSNRGKAVNAIRNAKTSQKIKLKIMDKNNASLKLSYSIDHLIKGELIHFALVDKYVKNEVPRGENRGRVLSHYNVVRVFKTLEANKSGNITISLPENLTKNTMVIAYVQDQNSFKITGASKLSL